MNDPAPNCRLRLHYAIFLANGALFDRSDPDAPLEIALGDGALHPALERCLRPLQAGQRARFELPAEHAFGPYEPAKLQCLERALFTDPALLEPGAVILFDTPAGESLPGRVLAIEADTVRVDFNHPLAGQDIVFEVHVLARE